jgi:hypothetical protein
MTLGLATAAVTGLLILAQLTLMTAGYVLAGSVLGLPTPGLELEAHALWARGLALFAGSFLLYDGLRTLVRMGILRPGPPRTQHRIHAYRRSARRRTLLRGGVGFATLGMVTLGLPLGAMELAGGEALFLLLMMGALGVMGFLVAFGLIEASGPRDRYHQDRIVPADVARRLEEGDGIAARAVLEDMHEAGWMVNERPLLHLELRVTREGREPYPVTVTEEVPPWGMGRLLQGATLPVRVDPDEPEHLVILWKEP